MQVPQYWKYANFFYYYYFVLRIYEILTGLWVNSTTDVIIIIINVGILLEHVYDIMYIHATRELYRCMNFLFIHASILTDVRILLLFGEKINKRAALMVCTYRYNS